VLYKTLRPQHTWYNNIRVNVFKMAHENVNNSVSQTIFISNNVQEKIEISRQITERSVFFTCKIKSWNSKNKRKQSLLL